MSEKLIPLFRSALPIRKYRLVLLLCAMLSLSLAACVPPTAVPTLTPAPQRSPTATVTQFIFPPTYTPTEAGLPTATNTPGPSRTPVPTQTLGPTLPPSPTPLVEILTASAEDGPFVTSRLLFLDDIFPRIWDPGTGNILSVLAGTLPENFDRISLSRGGAYLAVSSTGAAGPVIVVYNRFTEEIVRSVAAEGESLFDLAISPNGLWLAYITSTQLPAVPPTATPLPSGTPTATPEAGTTPTGTPTATPTPSSSSVLEREVYFIDLIEEGGPRFVANCSLNCTGITWSPGSDFFVWGQADGLWGVVPGPAGDPELLLEPFVAGISGGVQTTDSYLPRSISPSSRFVLVRNGIRTGTVLSVLDRATDTLENLPGTGSYTGVGTGMTWLSDDTLFIARPGIAALGLLPAGELWGLPGIGDSLFARLAEFPFPGSADVRPGAPVELPDGRIGFSLVNLRDGNDAAVNGLYLLDPDSGELERVNYLPLVLVDELVWLPDLSGALVLSESRLLFVPAGFGPVYSMRLLLGTDACCFRWIP